MAEKLLMLSTRCHYVEGELYNWSVVLSELLTSDSSGRFTPSSKKFNALLRTIPSMFCMESGTPSWRGNSQPMTAMLRARKTNIPRSPAVRDFQIYTPISILRAQAVQTNSWLRSVRGPGGRLVQLRGGREWISYGSTWATHMELDSKRSVLLCMG